MSLSPLDHAHQAALVMGRGGDLGPLSAEVVARCRAIAQAESARSGLPLGFVIAAEVSADSGDIYAGAAAGIVIACANEDAPAVVSKVDLHRYALADISASFWTALAREGVSFPTAQGGAEGDASAQSAEGLFLIPSGWSVAELYLGVVLGEGGHDDGSDPNDAVCVLGTSSEDSAAALLVTDDVIEMIDASASQLTLIAAYC